MSDQERVDIIYGSYNRFGIWEPNPNLSMSADEQWQRMLGRRHYDATFAGGKDPIPPAMLPFGGVRPVRYIDDVEFYSWTAV